MPNIILIPISSILFKVNFLDVIEIITPHFKEHQSIFEKIQDKAKETSDKIK